MSSVVRRKTSGRPGRRRRAQAPAVALCLGLVVTLTIGYGSGTAPRAAAARQGMPQVNPDYLYSQLYTMATSFSYRISGADGPPQDPSSPFNLPPTVNGWQELLQYWKKTLTSDKVNGPVAGFATVADHYFRRSGGYRFDSDDAEVTIPGATCPGQRVLTGAHPDETPVPAGIVNEIDSGSTSAANGFDAARRAITDSNLGNEGAYDGLSGVALTMGEYQALLEWYAANGSYPARTLKVVLLDASRGIGPEGLFSREGSGYYAGHLIPRGPQGQYLLFANMDSLGLDYPAYHLGTEFYWNNVTGGGVGPWSTFINAIPDTPNAAYPDTGPGSPGAEITQNTAAISQFRTDLEAAVSAGFAEQGAKYDFSVPLENPLRYNQTGQAPDPYSGVVETKPAYSPADQAQFSPVRDDTTALEDEQAFFGKGIPGFTVSGVKNSTSDENPYAASVSADRRATPIIGYAGNQTTFQIGDNTPPGAMTTTAAPAAAGDTSVQVSAVTGLAAGQPVFIGTGSDIEYNTISSAGTGPGGTGVTLATPLRFAHPSGVPFNVNQPQPLGYTGDTLEHLNYFASGAPHGPAGPAQPSQELMRALELPAEWSSLLLAGDHYLGATAHPRSPVAYFETTPVQPDSTQTVTFDASFSRDSQGSSRGLTYYWDFGDGTHATGETVTHTYASPVYADVKLVVGKAGRWGAYRQAVAVGKPPGPAPATGPCGTVTGRQAASLIAAAKAAGAQAHGREVTP